MAKSSSRDAGPAPNHLRKQPSSARRLHMQGVVTIESVLGSGSEPVLGLYLHTVHNHLLKGITRDRRYSKFMPHLIGTLALLSKHPGLSRGGRAARRGAGRAAAGGRGARGSREG